MLGFGVYLMDFLPFTQTDLAEATLGFGRGNFSKTYDVNKYDEITSYCILS